MFLVLLSLLQLCDAYRILILGSGGLIGSALKSSLISKFPNQLELFEVVNRRHVDLRSPSAWANFTANLPPIDFVFFLACEVGGSKYLESSLGNVQLQILESNLAMYRTVFPWLLERQVRFLFTSSSLQSQESAYGVIKRLGEQYLDAVAQGKSVRLWNVFGEEIKGQRSRVITDWIDSCLDKGQIRSLTDGFEFRQFVYAKDCAEALILMMEHYDEIDSVTDLGSNQWTQMRDLAVTIARLSPVPCDVVFSNRTAKLARSDAPNLTSSFYRITNWTPRWTWEQSLSELFAFFETQLNQNNLIAINKVQINKISCV